ERETIRERTKMGMNERIKSGYWRGGGHVPFGYDYDSKQGILVPNADAETVARVFELYIAGSSTLRIARLLGLKYERMASQILRRKTYAGYILYGGAEYKGRHEPIISLETYENAARVMRGRSSRSLVPARSLLAGLLVCGVCGSKMRYQKWGARGYKIYCYSQDSAKTHLARGDGECDNEKIWADEVENAVLSDFFRMSGETVKRGERGGDGVEGLLIQRRASVQRRLRNLYNLYSTSEDDALMSVIADARSELAEIDAEAQTREERQRSREQSIADAERLDGIQDLWEHMTLSEKQSILRDYIEKIVITNQNIDIYYRI
ncbi:MAG: recombinase family protein, partial [Eubacteriales bacterium]